ncbi:teichoic acid biosynthesis protein, partial [Staphylococcus simiae]|uniref:CDP-glycerol glycerophosphotransferase family protein n=1 Tax=Staphylococcus simiae TaxID=308354 RepID=UPI000CD39D85
TNLTIAFIRLNKTIYFYVKDRASINFNMNIGINKLPGSISYNIEELLKNLNKPLSDYLSFYHSNIKKFINEYCSKDDGLSCSRITEFIFNNTSREKSLKSNKKVVLFYGGAFYNNGITSSIINLSKIFNYDKYELIIIKTNKSTPEKLNNIKRLDSRAHLITLFSDMNKSLRDTIDLKLFNRQGYNSKYVHKKRIVRLFKEYFQQTLGNIKPEVVIDYSGYNKLFSALFAFAPVKKNAIFLHNDMYEEYNKIIDGRYKHRWNLKVVFSLYNQYSKVVSVSDSANQANMYNLKKFVNSPENKMITIPNIIDGDYVIEKANSSNEFKLNEIYMYNK